MAEKDNNKKNNKIKPFKIVIIGLIIAFFVIPILVYIVKVNDGKWDDNSSVRSVVYSKTATISGTRSISPSSSGNGYSYNANIEEITQEIIDEVNEDPTNSDVLIRYLGENVEEQKRLLAKFIKAEHITQYPDLRSKNFIGKETDDYELQGCIRIRRSGSGLSGESDEASQPLEYMPYDEFMEMVDKNDSNVLNYFTLQDSNYVRYETSFESSDNREEEEIEGTEDTQYSSIDESANSQIVVHLSPETQNLISLDDVSAWQKVTGGLASAEKTGNKSEIENYLRRNGTTYIEVPVRVWVNPNDNTDFRTTKSTIKKLVNKAVAPLFIDFFTDLYENCPNFIIDKSTTGSGTLRDGDWSSAHFYGCAFDVNWNTIGMTYGSKGNVHGPYTLEEWSSLPKNHAKYQTIYYGSPMEELIHKYSLDWGGQWKNLFDGMHISFIGDSSRSYLQDMVGTTSISLETLSDSSNKETRTDLIVATWMETTVEITSNEEDVESGTTTEYNISTSKFAYQSITDQITLTQDVLWDLLVITEDADFVSDLADIALNSKIIITVQDNLNIDIDTDVYNYDKEEKIDEDVAVKWVEDTGDDYTLHTESGSFEKKKITPYERTTVTTTKINTVNMDVTYADTWILTYKNKYTNQISELEQVSDKTYTGDDIEELANIENLIRDEKLTAGKYSQAQLQSEVGKVPDASAWVAEQKKNAESSIPTITTADIQNKLRTEANSQNEEIKNIIDRDISDIVSIIKSSNYSDEKRNYLFTLPGRNRPEVNGIIERTHGWYIIQIRKNPSLIINSVNIKEYDNKINQKKHNTIQVANNTYIQGTPVVKEKTNETVSTYSTVGLEWIKTWENYPLKQFMDGEISWESSSIVQKCVNEDGTMYKAFDEPGLNNSLNFAYGFKYTNSPQNYNSYAECIEQVRFLYQALHDIEDVSEVSDDAAIKEIMENYGHVGDEIPVEVADFAIMETYRITRESLIEHIENAQNTYGGAGIDEFTTEQLDALEMNYYAGWSNREEKVARIYKCILDGNDAELDSLIKYSGNDGSTSQKQYREDALRALFFEGKYRTSYYYLLNDEDEVLDPSDYTDGEMKSKYGFISLINKYPKARRNYISGAGFFFDALETRKDATEQADIMRWLLYLLTEDYNYAGYETDWLSLLERNDKYTVAASTDINVYTLQSKKEIVLNSDQLRDAITQAYKDSPDRQKNLLEHIDEFIQMQERYHVNALFAATVSVIESGAGTSWSAIDSSTNNWFSISGSYNGKTYHNPNSSNPLSWRVYPDVRTAIMDFGDLIANSTYYFKAGKYKVNDIAESYCDSTWGKAVNSEMKRVYKTIGINFGTEFTFGIEVYNTDGSVDISSLNQLKLALESYVGLKHCATDASHAASGIKVNNSDIARVRATGVKYWNSPYCVLGIYQCTWWAYGRASMYLESQGIADAYPTQYGNGGDYWKENIKGGWFNYGKTPKPNSLLSKAGTGTTGINACGHVMYVEAVDQINQRIYVSHAGGGTTWNGISCITFSELQNNRLYHGFIYLDEPKQDLSWVKR